jgi:hypothetical protein
MSTQTSCKAVILSGKNKGQICGNKTKDEFCGHHKKYIKNEIIPSSDIELTIEIFQPNMTNIFLVREYIKSRLTKYSVGYLIPYKTNTYKINANLLSYHQHQNLVSCIMTNIPPRIEPIIAKICVQ